MIEKCPKKAIESISERLKFKNFLGGMPPDPLHIGACIALGPPTENKETPAPGAGYGPEI